MAGVLVAYRGFCPAIVTVLLVIVQLVHCVSSDTSSSLEVFWQHELPGAPMPATLQKTASPLTPSSAGLILSHLKAGSDSKSLNEELCSSAPVYCAQKATFFGGPQPRVCIPPFFQYEYGELPCEFSASDVADAAASGIFFSSSALLLGQTIRLPDTSNDLSEVAFLPDSLASALPVDSDHLPELQRLFGVAKGSQMELDMSNTAAHCSFRSESHEVRGCEASGEALVRFVSQTLGDEVIVLSSAARSKQEAKVVDVHLVNSADEKTVSCHSMEFPSLVYSCHMTHTTQVLDVSLTVAGGKSAHALAVCHSDTSYWNPDHVAFRILNTKPGKSTICHWVPENTLIFAQQKMM